MHINFTVIIGLVAVMALLGAFDYLLARALGRRLEIRVLLVALVVPLILLGPWLTSQIVLAPTNLTELIIPGAPQIGAPNAHNTLNDAVYQFLPWELEIRHAFKAGRLPLWSDLLEGGSSLWVNPQAGVLSPLVWLARPFEIQNFLLVMVALKIEHALLGMWLLCRRVGVGRGVAILAATGFSICGAMSAWALFPHTTSLAWVPWLIFAVIELLRSHKGQRIAVVSFVTAALLLSGHPEVAAGGGILAGIVGLALRNRRASLVRSLGAATLAAVLGFGLAAPLIVPFARHLPDSQRAHETVGESTQGGDWSLIRPRSWFGQIGGTLLHSPLNPRQFGVPYQGSFTGTMNWAESTAGYPGIAALIGAAVALAGPLRRRALPFLAFFFVALLLAAQANPLMAVIDLIPPIRAMAYSRLLMPAGVAIWVAAAIGFQSLSRSAPRPWLRPLAAAAMAILILTPHRDAVVVALVLLGVAGVVVWHRTPRIALAMLIALTILDLLPWTRAQLPKGDPALFYPRTEFITQVAEEVGENGSWRAVGEDWGVFPSLLPVYGIPEVRPHNPLAPMRQIEALTHAFGFSPNRDVYFPPFRNPGHPLLDFLNVRAVVWNSGNEVPTDFERIDDGSTPAYRLYRNPDALPRWFFPTRISRVDGQNLGPWIEAMSDGSHVAVPSDGRSFVIAAPDDRLETMSSSAGRVTLGITARQGALVATSMPWPEGWSVTTEGGERLETAVVNGAFLGFVVPSGEHVVTLRFLPPGFWSGLWIAFAAAIVCVVLSIRVPWRRDPRPV